MKKIESELSRISSSEVLLLNQVASLKEELNFEMSKSSGLVDENIELTKKLSQVDQLI